MRKQYFTTQTPALFFALFSVLVFTAASFTALKAQAGRADSEKCSAVLTPMSETERQSMLDTLIDKNILLGAFQAEALLRVASAQGRLDSAKISSSGAMDPKNAAGAKVLRRFLYNDNISDKPARRALAEGMVKHLETIIFPKTVRSDEDKSVYLSQILGEFHFGGLLQPKTAEALAAWNSFESMVKNPVQREFLIDLFENTNATMANFAYKGHSGGATGALLFSSLFVGFPIFTGLTGFDFNHHFLMVMGGGLMTGIVPTAGVVAQRPIAALRLKITRSLHRKRLQSLVSRDLDHPALLEQASEKDLDIVFDREMVKTEAKELEKIKASIGSGDFSSIELFGKGVISRVDQAADLIGLMSKRMDILETDIGKLSNSIVNGKLKITLENAASLNEHALEVSSSVLKDGEQLEGYLNLLEDKIAEHISVGQAALEAGKLSRTADIEMRDVLEELINAESVLKPSSKILPMTIEVAQVQRTVLREIRANLRGRRLSQTEQISKLTESLAKLNSLKPREEN